MKYYFIISTLNLIEVIRACAHEKSPGLWPGRVEGIGKCV